MVAGSFFGLGENPYSIVGNAEYAIEIWVADAVVMAAVQSIRRDIERRARLRPWDEPL